LAARFTKQPALDLRRFPPPWSIDELEACFVVRDHIGPALAYVYFEEEPGRRSAANLLTKNEKSRRVSNHPPFWLGTKFG
jgi:hypothetical protein